MNERIEELMFEAGRYADKNTGSSDRSGMWVYQYSEKFAELIVKACADAADMAQDARCEYAGDYVAEYLGFGQEHGVTKWRAE
jgi:hypothetical protein